MGCGRRPPDGDSAAEWKRHPAASLEFLRLSPFSKGDAALFAAGGGREDPHLISCLFASQGGRKNCFPWSAWKAVQASSLQGNGRMPPPLCAMPVPGFEAASGTSTGRTQRLYLKPKKAPAVLKPQGLEFDAGQSAQGTSNSTLPSRRFPLRRSSRLQSQRLPRRLPPSAPVRRISASRSGSAPCRFQPE